MELAETERWDGAAEGLGVLVELEEDEYVIFGVDVVACREYEGKGEGECNAVDGSDGERDGGMVDPELPSAEAFMIESLTRRNPNDVPLHHSYIYRFLAVRTYNGRCEDVIICLGCEVVVMVRSAI